MPENPNWLPPSPFPALTPRELHVWRILLDPSPTELARLRTDLAADEIARADRFIFERHRNRFIAGRGALRAILGNYLGIAAEQLRFTYEPLGKPLVEPAQNQAGLQFNFSNSHTLGMLVVGQHVPQLGIDVEFLRHVDNLRGLAERFFDPAEAAAVMAQSGSAQQATFFRLWTRKEAFLKAVGKGLTFPLNQVVVSHQEAEPPAILSIAGDPSAARPWRLLHAEPEQHYFSAVAYHQPDRPLIPRYFGWSGDRGMR